ncbi:MAG: T9SS C-terminal target domain-containing protein [Calditrichaeota bacterium]|nr:MAG: T9SS C-terminal target domain-containing protein [Calditrichota bacterium]MBL1207715.1 T9SS C-terminal target domain-containing protein [Calditrichota bacterium]NOG47550.1 T9SS type A sorting domain-containing protein [Calditrichota bacterium]
MIKQFLLIFLILSLTAVNGQLKIEKAFPEIFFNRPIDLQYAPDNSDRIFVADQQGYIHVFPNDSSVISSEIFFNISDSISRVGNEEGLLGLAFHPNYKKSGHFFVYYSAKGAPKSIVARYSVSPQNPDSADQSTKKIIMEIEQPYRNHNGGQIAFGPDGYLYIALGDGGSGGDPKGHGQNRKTLLGSILRIDVDSSSQGNNYTIPADNPFVGNDSSWREEIYAYGLRNPWRFSFDIETNLLWCADVGQNAYEEIDLIESGKNYGWNTMEGFHCYGSASCIDSGLTMPIWEYPHNGGDRSVSGGYVYRGTKNPELYGKYIYADFLTGEIWALQYDSLNGAQNELLLNSDKFISAFGVDQNNELYICAFDGWIYKFEPIATGLEKNIETLPKFFRLHQNKPNPFNPSTKISFELSKSGTVEISIFNINGQKVKSLYSGFKQQGLHNFIWNGEDDLANSVSSGIYFYKLIYENKYVETRRMLLIK